MEIPSESWKLSARNFYVKNGYLYAELRNCQNNYWAVAKVFLLSC